MNILVTGASGQLGSDVVNHLKDQGHDVIAADKDEFDITDSEQVKRFILSANPDGIIHCAAYTAVDKAENEVELCQKVNADATGYIAQAAELCNAKMIYISTDYVYGGTGDLPIFEDAIPSPLNIYGKTKLSGELLAKQFCSKLFIVRTSWVFGLHGANFVKTMLRLGETHKELTVVSDQVGSPTFTEDLAKLLCDMIVTDKYGTYNASNEGYCSWQQFAATIFQKSGMDVTVHPITTESYGAPAVRPKNSRLSKIKLVENGFSLLPTWEDALNRFLTAYLVKES